MKTTQVVIILSMAIVLVSAIASNNLNNNQSTNTTLAHTSTDMCVPVDETVEENCATNANGLQCTAIVKNNNGNEEVAPAYAGTPEMEVCVIQLRRD